MRHPARNAATALRIAAAAVLFAAAACATSTDRADDTPVPTTAAAAAPEATQPADTTSATSEAQDTAPSTTEASEESRAPPEQAEDDEPDDSAAPDDEPQTDEDGAADDDSESENEGAPEQESVSDDNGESGEADTEPEAADEDSTQDDEPAAEPATEIDRVRGLLDALTVAAEATGDYDRNLFKHWTDADRDGCDTRKEVLLAEATRAPQIGSRCALSGGEWLSRYDGKTTSDTGTAFDVDHLVPLQEAWQSGARDWNPNRREQYANYLEYPDALIAVSASSNRSKGARDPAEWLPPSAVVHCWYTAAWINVKTIFDFTVDQSEADALEGILDGCDDNDLNTWPQAQTALDNNTEDETESSDEDSESEEAAPETDPADDNCHPAYEPCLPNQPGDAINCSDLTNEQKPVRIKEIGVDPYRLDRDNDGRGCAS